MRRLREQPRRLAARLSFALAVVVAAAAVGSALASDGPEPPPDGRPRLERSERLLRERGVHLDRLTDRAERLRRELRAARRRGRALVRGSERLRRDLQVTRRSLARERRE